MRTLKSYIINENNEFNSMDAEELSDIIYKNIEYIKQNKIKNVLYYEDIIDIIIDKLSEKELISFTKQLVKYCKLYNESITISSKKDAIYYIKDVYSLYEEKGKVMVQEQIIDDLIQYISDDDELKPVFLEIIKHFKMK